MQPRTEQQEQHFSNVVVELPQINKNQTDDHHHDQYKLDIHLPETCHKVSQDSWLQVGFILTTTMNSAYVLGYPGTVMVPLGWIGGVVGLMVASAISLYANILAAKLHECGGKRHIRYRDLAGHIYGRKMYVLTWVLQYVNLFMFNAGYIILAGSSIKAVYVPLSDDGALKLPHCIAMAGFVSAVFAMGVPHLSAMRIWLGVSTLFSLVYMVITFSLSFKDGIEAPPRDYSIPVSGSGKLFQTIGAATNLFFLFNSGMLPEIQATVRQPAVGNMIKALYLVFSSGVLPVYAVTFIAYWAYGSSTPAYLLNSVNGPIWVKALANISAFLQTVITSHVVGSPVYEFMDTRFGNFGGSALSLRNVLFRIIVRGSYLGVITLFAAILPFLGDFMVLTSGICILPLAFILPNHMYLTVKGNKIGSVQKAWHWLNIVVFSIMSVTATVSAIKLIAVDSNTFNLFADM